MLSAMPHRALLVLPLLLAACGSELEPAWPGAPRR